MSANEKLCLSVHIADDLPYCLGVFSIDHDNIFYDGLLKLKVLDSETEELVVVLNCEHIADIIRTTDLDKRLNPIIIAVRDVLYNNLNKV